MKKSTPFRRRSPSAPGSIRRNTSRCTRTRSPIPRPSGQSRRATGSSGSQPFTQVKDASFDANDFHIRWFDDGKLNVSANCLDRHLAKRGDQTAILWERDDPNERRAALQLSRAARRRLPLRQRAEGAGRREGRSRHDLHADDPRGGGRDARLRAHRRDPLGRVRRLLARRARGPDRRLRVAAS